MTRTKLCDRPFVNYTKGEEIFNFVSHTVGGAFGVFALLACLFVSTESGNVLNIIGSSIYGSTMIILYTMSSIYHALPKNMGKKVMQILDHCTIYFLIAGTYTPILFGAIIPYSPVWGIVLLSLVWACAIVGCVFTAIDLKKFSKLSMVCYLTMGWCIVFIAKTAIAAIPYMGLLHLLIGGIFYTVGAVLFGLGKKIKYMHSVFHIFVVLGSVFQFLAIVLYIL